MNFFVFNADIYCEDCGNKIRERLTAEGKAPANPDHESTYDSNDFPKGPYHVRHYGESDSPSHCGAHENCVNAFECPIHGTHKIGMFLENPLTSDGYGYVEEACRDAMFKDKGCVALDVWAPFYSISLEDDDNYPHGE